MKQNLPPCLPYWFMLINLLINIPLKGEHSHKLKIHTVEMDLLTTGEGGGHMKWLRILVLSQKNSNMLKSKGQECNSFRARKPGESRSHALSLSLSHFLLVLHFYVPELQRLCLFVKTDSLLFEIDCF